jgi:hypothetical protein
MNGANIFNLSPKQRQCAHITLQLDLDRIQLCAIAHRLMYRARNFSYAKYYHCCWRIREIITGSAFPQYPIHVLHSAPHMFIHTPCLPSYKYPTHSLHYNMKPVYTNTHVFKIRVRHKRKYNTGETV